MNECTSSSFLLDLLSITNKFVAESKAGRMWMNNFDFVLLKAPNKFLVLFLEEIFFLEPVS